MFYVEAVHSVLLLSSIPMYKQTRVYESVATPLLVETWTVLHFGLLKAKLLGILLYKTIACTEEICACISLGLNHLELLDHGPHVYSELKATARLFPRVVLPFYKPTENLRGLF